MSSDVDILLSRHRSPSARRPCPLDHDAQSAIEYEEVVVIGRVFSDQHPPVRECLWVTKSTMDLQHEQNP